MNNELILLEASCHLCEEFLPFVNRKDQHSGNELHKSHASLPVSFFNESKLMLKKHSQQWTSNFNLQLVLAAEKEISVGVSK